jgi:ring-1,2-phenylacetyl-CoA epoxidase subunit PaaE
MSNTFHTVTVKNIERQTESCVTVELDIPSSLKDAFRFEAGQYLTLMAQIGNEEVRRSYSLCSAPYEETWKVAIKEIPNGKFSSYANRDLKIGDSLQVMAPMGNFKLLTTANGSENHVFFAAGSGITPIISMIKTMLRSRPTAKAILFYGNRDQENVIFKTELEVLSSEYPSRLFVYQTYSRQDPGDPCFYGRIDAEKCRIYSERFFNASESDAAYLCGPAEMIFAVRDALTALGMSKEKIKFELFSTDGLPKEDTSVQEAPKLSATTSKVQVQLHGEIIEFEMAQTGKSILDAALDHGADLPYSCKGGVCCTCKAQVQSGEVKMEVNYALDDDEVEEGFILSCQSHPISEEVFVDFDVF